MNVRYLDISCYQIRRQEQRFSIDCSIEPYHPEISKVLSLPFQELISSV